MTGMDARLATVAEVLADFVRPANHDETCSVGCFATHDGPNEAAQALAPLLAEWQAEDEAVLQRAARIVRGGDHA